MPRPSIRWKGIRNSPPSSVPVTAPPVPPAFGMDTLAPPFPPAPPRQGSVVTTAGEDQTPVPPVDPTPPEIALRLALVQVKTALTQVISEFVAEATMAVLPACGSSVVPLTWILLALLSC